MTDARAPSLIETVLNNPTVREAVLIGIIVNLTAKHRNCNCLGCRIRYFVSLYAEQFHK
jgi:hypothetical protein